MEDFIHVDAEQAEEFAFLGRQFGLLAVVGQNLLLGVEGEAAQLEMRAIFILLAIYAAKYGFNTEGQFFH